MVLLNGAILRESIVIRSPPNQRLEVKTVHAEHGSFGAAHLQNVGPGDERAEQNKQLPGGRTNTALRSSAWDATCEHT